LFFECGVGNNLIGDIAACGKNLHAHKAATSRSLARRSFFAHEKNHEIGPVLPQGNEMNPKALTLAVYLKSRALANYNYEPIEQT
jgi:hypothetical protein